MLLKPANPIPSKQNCERLKKTLSRKSVKSAFFKARAIFDYTAFSDREISFQIGGILCEEGKNGVADLLMIIDVLTVFREDEIDGWLAGDIDGKIGFFPKDFVLAVGDKTNEKIIKVS